MLQQAKQLVRNYYECLDNAELNDLETNTKDFLADQYLWRGYHPFNEQQSYTDVVSLFWQPLRQAFKHLQRREDIFMAGVNRLPEGKEGKGVWVVSMGHLMGLLDDSWLGIAATGKMTFLRYCEFHKVEGNKIVETAMYFDIPHVMMQAGLNPFPPMTGAQLVQPGPITHTGLLYDEVDPVEGNKTIALIDSMVDNISTWQQEMSLEDELRQHWCEDMIWWGPTGIGASYTIERYAKQHSGPFRAGFKDRIFKGHLCRIAEGEFGGFFGWPNLTLEPTGGFMGMPATGKPGDLRVIDIYRRKGDKLAENWIFIDLLHFWNQQGLDILDRMNQVPRT
ncbi:polyketide cyclase [Marinomonas sp. S3726]|uniref:ester cyclase n=1 Tax=Marinomonas sp. S3726 TaxID=579484 RepID=UPI0005FA90F9|nr:ester cyclase [Marinomonas sp. S3726]KJZ16049.1 polyketide cyclase [Marinomonas sp. S3726]